MAKRKQVYLHKHKKTCTSQRVMARVLLCWLGDEDVRSATKNQHAAVSAAATAEDYDRILLLNNRGLKFAAPYIDWLQPQTSAKIEHCDVKLSNPANFGQIYQAVVPICEVEAAAGSKMTFHLSPGTGPMGAIWLLLGKTRFRNARLIQSSREEGVVTANVPFDIALDVLPDLLAGPSRELVEESRERAPVAAAFSSIIHRSPQMKRAIAQAYRFALWPFPVLIEGESGTGKELFARAIHDTSPRRGRAFVAVNCGAIPKDLVEAELFGYEKGAFTGADKAHPGYFEQAHGGTLFLDELGELPADTQVKLLRAIESGEIRRLKATSSKKVDARIVAATNRSLPTEIAKGTFREDLFYRLVVGRLTLPPLREREGDVGLLLDHALEDVNRSGKQVPGYVPKRFSAGAKNLLITHRWLGNVRELRGTVRRAAMWTDGPVIEKPQAEEALLTFGTRGDEILGRAFATGFDLREVTAEVVRHYVRRALVETNGVKTKAAKLLGLPSYQTLSNWMEKYGVQVGGTDIAD